MIFLEDRVRDVCPSCRAVGHGNATCRVCVAQWTRFGISQKTIDLLLDAIGDQPATPPVGSTVH